jgi:predicted metallo-beta-lactamase superfamily hydrolase
MRDVEEIKVDGVDITKDVYSHFAEIESASLASAEKEQILLMQAEKRVTNGERKNYSFGRLRMKICQPVYHFWGSKLGYEIWKDKTFLNWLEKRFGELVAIKSKSAQIQV